MPVSQVRQLPQSEPLEEEQQFFLEMQLAIAYPGKRLSHQDDGHLQEGIISRFAFLLLGLLTLPSMVFGGSPEKKDNGKLSAEKEHTDFHGDWLPPGAVSRLGTVRWRHEARMFTYSPDGRYLAVSGRKTWLLNVQSGQLIRRWDGPSNYLFFLPDSKTLLTTIHDPPLVQFWDVTTGKEVGKLAVGNTGSYAWSADGNLMLHRSYQSGKGPFVALWNLKTGKEIRRWEELPADGIALSPDGKTCALWEEKDISVRDTATGQVLFRFPHSPNRASLEQMRSLVYSPDGTTVACAGFGEVRLFDTVTGAVRSCTVGTGDGIAAVALSLNGRVLAAADATGSIHLWDFPACKTRRTFANVGQGSPIYLLAFAPDGSSLAGQAYQSPVLRVWDVKSGQELSSKNANVSRIQAVAFSPDGKTVATAGPQDPVSLWNPATGQLLRKCNDLGPIPLQPLSSLTIFPGNTIALFHGPHLSRMGDMQGTLLHEFKAPDQRGERQIYPCASPDGKCVIGVFPPQQHQEDTDNGKMSPAMIGLWEARTGVVTRSFPVRAENVSDLGLTADGRSLIGFGHLPDRPNKTVLFLWSMATGKLLQRTPLPTGGLSRRITSSRDGRTLILGPTYDQKTKKNILHFFETMTGQLRGEIECSLETENVPVMAFFGDRLAAMARQNIVHVIDPLTGQELRRLEGQNGNVTCLAFSADGRWLASGSEDSTTLVWDVSKLCKALPRIKISAQELTDRWSELALSDAGKAHEAICRLSQAPDQMVAFLREHLQPVPFDEKDNVQRLITQLDSKEYAVREEAMRKLAQMGEFAETALEQALKVPPSVEMKRRAEMVLTTLRTKQQENPQVFTPEQLQQLRALEVLERISTREAEQLLDRLAKGAPSAPLTSEAAASWQRMKVLRKNGGS